MTKDGWEVFVNEMPGMWSVEVFIINRTNKPALAHIKDNQIEMTDIKEGELNPEPTLRLNMEVWNALKTALIDKKVRDKSEVEAELSATKFHLEDMRKLVFKV